MTVIPTSFPLRGRIRLNQLLNNVRVNRNTKFKRLELLPLKSVFQIQSKNPTSPTDNGHCSTPPPPLPFAWQWWEWVPYPLGNFGQALSVFDHDMKIWFWQERAVIMLGLYSFRWLKDDWTDFSRRVNTGPLALMFHLLRVIRLKLDFLNYEQKICKQPFLTPCLTFLQHNCYIAPIEAISWVVSFKILIYVWFILEMTKKTHA